MSQVKIKPECADFSRRLYALMREKALTQSDLAGLVWGYRQNKQGYRVAANRDRISSYLHGRSMPDAVNIKKLAQVLGVAPEDLAVVKPGVMGQARPEFEIEQIPGRPKDVYFKMGRVMPMAVAMQIVAIIDQLEDTPT